MSGKQKAVPVSPTVTQVLHKFIGTMKDDDSIDNEAIDRLDKLLRDGAVPKPEAVYAALFQPPKTGET